MRRELCPRLRQAVGQPRMHSHRQKQHHHTYYRGTDKTVTEHLTGFAEITGAYEMCRLYGESERRGIGYAAEKPRGGLHQTYRRRCLRADVTHHGGVDEEHEYGCNLRENGRNTQSYDKTEFLACAHRLSLAYAGKKLVTAFQ